MMSAHRANPILCSISAFIATGTPAIAQPRLANLGVLPGLTGSAARDVSADGTVVVGNSGNQAFRWTASDGMIQLPRLPGGSYAECYAVSQDGLYAVGKSEIGASHVYCHAVRWPSSG